jgi:hypothetical protein
MHRDSQIGLVGVLEIETSILIDSNLLLQPKKTTLNKEMK